MGFEHELCKAFIINMTNKVGMLTTRLLLEAIIGNTKAIFMKSGWLFLLRNTSDFPWLRLWGWALQKQAKWLTKEIENIYQLGGCFMKVSLLLDRQCFFTQSQLKVCKLKCCDGQKKVTVREFGTNKGVATFKEMDDQIPKILKV